MLTNGQLHDAVATNSRRYADLKAKFAEFTTIVSTNLTRPDFPVRAITVKPMLDANLVEIGFAGRTLQLYFSAAIPEESQMLMGSVQAYIVRKLPKEESVHVDGFSFKPNGESNIKIEGDLLYVTWDLGAIYLALHLLNESLRK